MVDDHPTVWQAEPHTLAKHAILEKYLQAWFPILSRQSHRVQSSSHEILFIDGFAGPGEYEKGECGSPIIALKTALHHSANFPIPIRLLFIEQDAKRCAHLKVVLEKYSKQVEDSINVRVSPPCEGSCDQVLSRILDQHERKGTHFGPALAFLDQFGYSAVPMNLAKRILALPQCEVFSYLDYKGMNRWITDPTKADSFTRTYGGDEWRKAISMPESERRRFLLDTYMNALQTRANATYTYSFAMFDKAGQPLYWLIFSTNNLRGLEEMKKAMWAVDKSGGFRFSDKDNPQQLKLLNDTYDDDWLADTLVQRCAGTTMTVAEIKEFVLTATPCCLYKKALHKLEKGPDPRIKVVRAPTKRRAGAYPDGHIKDIVVEFGARRLF